MKLWGGRFKESESKLMEDFNSSLSFDMRLYKEDILGSIAHVTMLCSCKILSEDEGSKIKTELENILKEIESGELVIEGEYEDIHSFVEYELIKRIGELGKKLHTARSRNDQVAVDMKMYTIKNADLVIEKIDMLLENIKKIGEENPYIMPGYTHLQRAQIITFKYYIMAYYEMFSRDKKRILNTIDLAMENPLGSGALAGSTYNIDRNITTLILGFNKPVENFLDGVSDRDYLIEIISDFSIIMMHLSRLSEELINFSSKEFGFITISDEFSTGSSIMPQKKNPDACELIRGKCGRVYGDLISLLTTMKGLPLAYNKDMQEDKENFFDALDTTVACLSVMNGVLSTLTVNKDKMLDAVKSGFLNATEVADYLVKNGLEFRNAHKVVGNIVLYCEDKNKNIEDMTLEEFSTFSNLFKEDIYEYIDYYNILNQGIKKEIQR